MKLPKKTQPDPTPDFLPKVVKKSAHGKVLFSQIQLHPTEPMMRTHTGVEGGKVKISAWSSCRATNTGRANERDPMEQTRSQAINKRNKLLRKGGYYEVGEDMDVPKFFLPMLAQSYDKKHPPAFPVRVQPKLNGGRCVATEQELRSRYGDLITMAAPHILKAVQFFYKQGALPKGLILDGELYNHAYAELLNRIMKMVRKKKLTPEMLAESEKHVEFHIYDCYDPSRPHLSLEMRRIILARFATAHAALGGKPCIKFVPTPTVTTKNELDGLYHGWLKEHYEGAMIRATGSVYEPGKRSANLLKYKPRYDAEYPIVEILDGNGKRKNMAARVVILLPDGSTSKANIKWKDQKKIEIWNKREKLKGTLCTVSHAGLTEFGKPFHAYLEVLHETKTRKI